MPYFRSGSRKNIFYKFFLPEITRIQGYKITLSFKKLLLRLSLFPIFASFAAGQNGEQIFLTENAVILVPPEQKRIIAEAAEQCAGRAAEFEILFGQPTGRIEIVIVRSLTEITGLSGFEPPGWSQAVALPEQNRIYIRTAKPEDLEHLPAVLLHELVHIHLAGLDKTNRIPWWLHEGLADLLSGEEIDFSKAMILSWLTLAGKKLDLTDLEHPGPLSGSGAGQSYALSLSATTYYNQTYGLESLVELTRAIGGGENYDRVFLRQTGENFTGFNHQWQTWIRQRYSAIGLISSPILIWIFILILMALAFCQIKRRNNQKISSWEDEYLEKN